jgi:pimeloyl-ACP methyl ester carboxylesterase
VIAPDTRGSGKSVHSGGPIPYTLLSDDVAALIGELNLDQPLVCGFSDGGETATILGIRNPGSVRAIVNHAGYDLFNPDPYAPAIAITRQMLGGSADATRADPELSASRSGELRAMFELMKSDHDRAQGAGHWKAVIAQTFDRIGYSRLPSAHWSVCARGPARPWGNGLTPAYADERVSRIPKEFASHGPGCRHAAIRMRHDDDRGFAPAYFLRAGPRLG